MWSLGKDPLGDLCSTKGRDDCVAGPSHHSVAKRDRVGTQ